MRTHVVLSLLLLASCRQLLGIDEPDPVPDAPETPPDVAPLPDCQAQRVVHVVAATGGLAWFTLVWPAPKVITQFAPTFAYDNSMAAKDLGTAPPQHALFARKLVGGRAVWEGKGRDPQPSVFIAGMNETHSPQPSSIVQSTGVGLIAAGASLQVEALAAPVPVLVIGNSGPYGQAMGAPAPVSVSNVEGGIVVLAASAGVAESQLRPGPEQLARYLSPGATNIETDVATKLAFVANALRLGVVSTVVLPAFNDDPHGAFTNGIATARANSLALALDEFYADLASANEPACGRGGAPLSMADNVVLLVTGDTPKNSFDNTNWPDGTPGNSNWIYVRSNGFTIPGWFGDIDPAGTRTNWDPLTGQLSGVPQADSTKAAWGGALYAISRGRRSAVQRFTEAPFAGTILR
ncbi:MAG: hypothetical protein KIT31_05205 [Deltaproteobacteria bacterium]|nr:hypothetical protein [Deltaproteobacteria bacterium]